MASHSHHHAHVGGLTHNHPHSHAHRVHKLPSTVTHHHRHAPRVPVVKAKPLKPLKATMPRVHIKR